MAIAGLVIGLGSLTSAGPVPASKPAAYPDWWFERDVIPLLPEHANETAPVWPDHYPAADDYAVVNQGQVKYMAKQAYEELEATLPGGAGSALDTLWATPSTSTDDFAVINLGQLKNVAEPFYFRLVDELGYTGQPLAPGQTRPWSGTADDFALANIGQVKNAFSFDPSNIYGPAGDIDGDGNTNEEEQLAGTDPLVPDSNYVVVNEVLYNIAADHRFIEIHNPSTRIINLSGWRIEVGSRADGTRYKAFVFPAGAVIPP